MKKTITILALLFISFNSMSQCENLKYFMVDISATKIIYENNKFHFYNSKFVINKFEFKKYNYYDRNYSNRFDYLVSPDKKFKRSSLTLSFKLH